MSLFIVVVTVLVIGSVIALIYPLLRTEHGDHLSNDSMLVQELATRQAELDRDRDSGLIDPSEYETALVELKRQILQRAVSEASSAGSATDKHSILSIILAVSVPASVVALYLYLGDTTMLDPSRLESAKEEPQFTDADLQRAVEQLRVRLAENPDDAQAWQLLVQSQLALGEPETALATLRSAVKSMPDDDDMKLVLVRFLVQSKAGAMAGEAGELSESLLERHPQDPEILFLAGAAAWQKDLNDLALERWERFLELPNIDPDKRRMVASLVMRAKADPSEAIAVSVSLQPELLSTLKGDETVFVFVRRRGVSGGPPLAAERLQVADLPIEISLVPGALMGVEVDSGAELEVSARVSRSGQPVSAAGDLQGHAVAVAGDGKGVAVSIDTVIK